MAICNFVRNFCSSAGNIFGTIQLVLNTPENQPHRADIAKMLVHRRAHRNGLGAFLLKAAEQTALKVRLGWQRCDENTQ